MILNQFSLETRIAEVKQSMESLQAEIQSQKSRRSSVDDEVEVKQSMKSLQAEIESHKSRRSSVDDEVEFVERTSFVQNAMSSHKATSSSESDDENDDSVRKVTIQEEHRPTQSTMEPDDQIFDVTITVKSCSFKKKQLQKYKLYIALIGEKAQSSWVEIESADITGNLPLQTHKL